MASAGIWSLELQGSIQLIIILCSNVHDSSLSFEGGLSLIHSYLLTVTVVLFRQRP